MKRYPVFAVAVLLFLLLFLLGSWVYVRNYSWPLGDDAPEQDLRARTNAGPADRAGADPFANVPDAEPEDGGTNGPGPLEPPTEPIRRAKPPEAINTGRGVKPETTSAKTPDVVVAELTPGLAAIRDRNGSEEGLDPFIVSTLPKASARQSFITSTLFSESDKNTERMSEEIEGLKEALAEPKILDAVFKGEVVWPSLPEEDAEALEQANRFQAMVYFEQLPEFRAIVDKENRAFRLPLTSKMQDDHRSKGLKLVVHSPAFELEGAFESVTVKKDDGPIKIGLQLAAKIVVVVDVTPPEAIADGVRVWLERQGNLGGPDHDDSLYMSAKVPSSGRLVFTVPEHYGEFRVAATGAQWHSGLPQVLNVRDWRTAKVAVTLELAADRCDGVSGVVKGDSSAEYEPTFVAGARLQMTSYGTTVYTGPDGQFAMYMPSDRLRSERQLIVTADRLRPEVVVLDRSDGGTSGVEGNALSGPVTVVMAWKMGLKLRLPKELSHQATVMIGGHATTGTVEISAGSTPVVEVLWGSSVLLVVNLAESGGQPEMLYISATAWQKAFYEYAAGRDSTLQITATTLEDAFKKR